MKKIFFFLVAFICIANITNAGLFRAGGITYRWISGLTYEFTLVTFTDSISYPEAVIECGDGAWDTLPLTNVISLPNGVKKNEYVKTHTYPAPGDYIISFESPNRIEGIVNIPNSVNVPFFVNTTLVINAFLGANNSTVLLNNLYIDTAFIGQTFIYNPAAYDIDGDSLVYTLNSCKGADGYNIPGYSIPQEVSLDTNTGDFLWDYPLTLGIYNFAIRIEEYRNSILIGYVLREIQIIVTSGTGINENNYTKDKIMLYPNPFTNSTTLQISKPLQNATLSIYDMLGKKVKSFINLNGTEIKVLNDGIKSGMYFFSLTDKNGYICNGKMMVE